MMERPRVLKTSTDAPAGPGWTVRGSVYAMLGLLGVFACLQVWWVTTAAYGVTIGFGLRLSVIVLMAYGGLVFLTYTTFRDSPRGFVPLSDDPSVAHSSRQGLPIRAA